MDQHAGSQPGPGRDVPEALPDTARTSGSEEEPGRRLDAPPLTDDDRAVLAALSRHDRPVVDAVEDTLAAAEAAEDDAPLPGVPPVRAADPLDPVFREPSS